MERTIGNYDRIQWIIKAQLTWPGTPIAPRTFTILLRAGISSPPYNCPQDKVVNKHLVLLQSRFTDVIKTNPTDLSVMARIQPDFVWEVAKPLAKQINIPDERFYVNDSVYKFRDSAALPPYRRQSAQIYRTI